MTRRLSLLLGILLAGAAIIAGPAGEPRANTLWDLEGAAKPDRSAGDGDKGTVDDDEYRRAMDEADALVIKAGKEAAEHSPGRITVRPGRRTRRPSRSFYAWVDLAVKHYERAAKLRPDAAEPHYRAAETLYAYVLSDPTNTPVIRDRERARRALAHWVEFMRLAPLDPRAVDVTLFNQALVHTKMVDREHLERAIACYEILIDRSTRDDNKATILGNLAETYMMVGRLDEAVVTYERAMDRAGSGGAALYAYGMAVALDRDGQGQLAREVMRTHAAADRLRAMMSDGIFFVPEGERFYYLALGAEATGELERAAEMYERFVESGAHPHFQPRAQENLARVRKELRRQGAGATLPRGLGL